MSHATDILNAAGIAIDTRGVERDRPDGERSMATAVKTFAAMTGRNLTETEGWLFMVCLKAARATGGAYREDDYTDMAAYAALAGESAGGEAPAIKAGCEHTATITSGDGLTTICASCSMPRPQAGLVKVTGADVEAMNQFHRDLVRDANSVEYAKMQKPTTDGQKACKHEFVPTGAGDKFDGKSLFCKYCGFTADCVHRYVQLTTGGLVCADCKAPWAK